MPSRYEGLALIPIEASLIATPVVATDAPGLRETLPADHPWIARAGDATSFAAVLQQALDQPERWAATGENARAFARESFAVKTMAEAYRSLYQQALATR